MGQSVEDKRENICLSRPAYDHYTFENDVTVHGMFVKTMNDGRYNMIMHFAKGSGLCTNRALAVQKARTWGCKWILWVDSDVMVFADSALKLLAHDLDIVSGVCVAKQEPYNIHAGYLKDGRGFPDNSLVDTPSIKEVDWVGFGFVLIKTEVFDKIEGPYFSFPGDSQIGEDIYFCLKAKAAGYKIHLDPGCQVGHVGYYTYTTNDMQALRQSKYAKVDNSVPLIVNPQGKVLVQ
jgi:GT2 family glycosyltransferase